MWLLIILGVPVAFILFLVIRERRGFYTKAICSVCGKETGIKGNKRYKLRDGYMCQSCAEKLVANKKDISGAGPAWFSSKTVDDVRRKHQERAAIGEEAWVKQKAEQQQAALRAMAAANREAKSVVRCPKCGSTQISADQKGFSAGKAVVGAAVAGPIGLAAGGIGSKKVIITCLKCGHQWQAGKG